MTTELNHILNNLIGELEKLPGIGRRSAERMAYHLLVTPQAQVEPLIQALKTLKKETHHCKYCYNISNQNPCDICQDDQRNQSLLCVVEQPRDLVKIERSGTYQGLYHVLHGTLSPLDGVTEDHLTLDTLLNRLKKNKFQEIILATGANLAGEATALHLQDLLQSFPGKVTRLARGLPTGGQLEFASDAMISDALSGRQSVHDQSSFDIHKKKGQALTEVVLILLFLVFSLGLLWRQWVIEDEAAEIFTPLLNDYHSWWQWPIP